MQGALGEGLGAGPWVPVPGKVSSQVLQAEPAVGPITVVLVACSPQVAPQVSWWVHTLCSSEAS